MNNKKQRGNKTSVKRQNNQLEVSQQSLEQSYSGPMPDPSDLEYYDKVVPGAAERIIIMAEKEQGFRHTISTDTTRKALDERKRGQFFAFFIALAGFGISDYALYLGHPVTASIIGGVTLTSMVTVFVTGKAAELKGKASK